MGRHSQEKNQSRYTSDRLFFCQCSSLALFILKCQLLGHSGQTDHMCCAGHCKSTRLLDIFVSCPMFPVPRLDGRYLCLLFGPGFPCFVEFWQPAIISGVPWVLHLSEKAFIIHTRTLILVKEPALNMGKALGSVLSTTKNIHRKYEHL